MKTVGLCNGPQGRIGDSESAAVPHPQLESASGTVTKTARTTGTPALFQTKPPVLILELWAHQHETTTLSGQYALALVEKRKLSAATP
jgi:hypothetical protein